MRTFALVGKSGTGKSYKSLDLTRANNIEAVIDDGLLISGNQILAGSSAKHEANKMASVKRAIFTDPLHQTAVKDAIQKNHLESVLIIGTSEKMVHRIAEVLGLPPFEHIFYIEDVATEEEIHTATIMRDKFGKHIIPAPVFEVKKQFSGYWLKSLFSSQNARGPENEKTVMRPTYSYIGNFRISPKVFSDICRFEVPRIDGIAEVLRVRPLPASDGCVEISVDVSLDFPCDIPKTTSLIQSVVCTSVEDSTSIVVKCVNVFVKTLKNL